MRAGEKKTQRKLVSAAAARTSGAVDVDAELLRRHAVSIIRRGAPLALQTRTAWYGRAD